MKKRCNESYDDFDNDGSDKDPRFSVFIKDKIEQYNEDSKDKMTIKKLGETLGIDYGMFRRKITKDKPIRERDCIIAICIELQLSPGEIDEALILYDMQPLNPKDKRDVLIESLVQKATLNEAYDLDNNRLNYHLRSMGFNELAIQKKKDNPSPNTTKMRQKASPYKVIKDAWVNSLEKNEIYYRNLYDSLSTEYDPFEIVMTGRMILADSQGRRYRLAATSTGSLSSKNLENMILKSYDSIEDTGDFKEFFIKLDSRVKLEWFRVLNIFKDTRNYRGRVSAKVANGIFTLEAAL